MEWEVAAGPPEVGLLYVSLLRLGAVSRRKVVPRKEFLFDVVHLWAMILWGYYY